MDARVARGMVFMSSLCGLVYIDKLIRLFSPLSWRLLALSLRALVPEFCLA